jgi:murein L,D-transpeptidase YcbB/YkuD
MIFRIGNSAVLPLVSLASVLALGVPHAGAENIFDALFGHNRFPAPPPPPNASQPLPGRSVKPASLPKVAQPTYRDYIADPLVKVDFAPVISATYPGEQMTLASGGFENARQGLDGFDLKAGKQIAKALVDYYSKHPDFIWVSGLAPNGRAEQVMKILGDAASYGLNPLDYAIAPPPADSPADDPAGHMKDLIRFEMKLSARVLRYVSDASNGRIDPDRLSDYFDLPQKRIDMVDVLTKFAASDDAGAYLLSFHPQSKQYQALRDELARLRQSTETEISVDPKILVHPGESNPEFPKILQLIADKADDAYRTQYGALLSSHSGDVLYSDDLIPAIKAAQKAHGLSGDGVIGPRTIQAFQGVSKTARIEKVLVALESMRWLPHNLGDTYVFINEPAFRVTYTKDGVEQLNMEAVVGKPTNQTTFFYDKIEEVTYNPYWGVPRSIIVNEMLPRLLRDPGYLDRSGYEVTDEKGRRIPSASIDWAKYGSNIPFNVRQEPSEENALGVLKILFPNKHAIYMHDTPEKYLFKRDVRAFSHGCVRLQEPRQMAAAVLGTTVAHIDEKLKQGHSTEKVPVRIPVYVAYFTAWPDQSGKVDYYNDIYGRDDKIEAAIAKVEAVREPQDVDLTGAVQREPLAPPKS